MLYPKDREGCKKGYYPLIVTLYLLCLSLGGCKEKPGNPNSNISIEAFSDLKTSSYALNSKKIQENIASLCYADKDSSAADYRTRTYYLKGGAFLWIDRSGIDSRPDTLLAELRRQVTDMGFSERSFDVQMIQTDLNRLRGLDFNDSVNTINRVMARLEYRLTKAYLRYVVGQRFGFVNPKYVFNRLDALREDSMGRALSYRKLYDVDIQRPDKSFYEKAFRNISNDSLGLFLRSVHPTDDMYFVLKGKLQHCRNAAMRRLLLCNMERYRWRENHPLDKSGKYVVVNIPSYHLYAYGPDSIVSMRIGCGSVKTKTPLLNSKIERMDVNPAWNIPMSIIQKDIVHHAGNAGYFTSRRYYIVERSTGKRIEPSLVTQAMLLSGAYRVSQEGGEGNALGRIIFRFANNFSVFLHDTSSKGVFSREDRSVSHGCVRVERPFDFAEFLLDNPDEWLLDRLRISMDMEPLTERGRAYVASGAESNRLIGSLQVKPAVPLSLAYYTLYREPDGVFRSWPDVYGFDNVIWQGIKPFMK